MPFWKVEPKTFFIKYSYSFNKDSLCSNNNSLIKICICVRVCHFKYIFISHSQLADHFWYHNSSNVKVLIYLMTSNKQLENSKYYNKKQVIKLVR